ncbi:hypothetical protein FHX81_2155 [Saccharothrix saharensis]|uniref:Uncharacterized protein n=1 Tax=Saccharothrix saharensis TaxID=571190 RepID=A0A543JAL5_9PSEU|nr:YcxB family protein [Saccharothrix saharensis]TQM79844.1 hypothetical protein FHX81_2155 [Saccharothrix saharensis]
MRRSLMVALGVVLMFPSGSTTTSVAVLVLVLVLVHALAVEPFPAWQSMRAQNPAVRQDWRLTADGAGFTMEAAAYDQRIAWSTVQRVEEEPDAGHLVPGRNQALAVAKDLTTEERRRAFVAVLGRRVSD